MGPPSSKKRKLDQTSYNSSNGKAADTTKPTAVFKPAGPRLFTLSVALPGSIIANAQSHDLKTTLAGQIARALAVFSVDEVVVFDDGQASQSLDPKNKAWDPDQRDHPPPHGDSYTGRSDPNHFLAHLLSYLETPPPLRRHLFPIHANLKTAGSLPSLDMPHHMRADDWCQYREGVTVERDQGMITQGERKRSDPRRRESGIREETIAAEEANTLVYTGLEAPVAVRTPIPPNTRVTLKFPTDTREHYSIDEPLVAEPVSPDVPREESGFYWGYNVRQASSLSTVFTEAPFDGGYDLSFGTSERGRPLDDVLMDVTTPLPSFDHILIVLGGVAGLEKAVQVDEALREIGEFVGLRERLDSTIMVAGTLTRASSTPDLRQESQPRAYSPSPNTADGTGLASFRELASQDSFPTLCSTHTEQSFDHPIRKTASWRSRIPFPRLHFRVPDPTQIIIGVVGVIIGIIATVCGTYIANNSWTLAKWTARKDYQEYCKEIQVAGRLDPDCEKALNETLPPPPFSTPRPLLSRRHFPDLQSFSQSGDQGSTKTNDVSVYVHLCISIAIIAAVLVKRRKFPQSIRRYSIQPAARKPRSPPQNSHISLEDAKDVSVGTGFSNTAPVPRWRKSKPQEEPDSVQFRRAVVLDDRTSVRRLLDKGFDPKATEPGHSTPLHLAAEFGQRAIAQVLLDAGADIDAGHGLQGTPLHQAVTNGHRPVVQLLLDRGAHLGALNNAEHTALQQASLLRDCDIAVILLEHGAAIEATDPLGHTPLHLAILDEYLPMLQLLLQSGANVNAVNHSGRTVLHRAASFGVNDDVIKLLVSYGADVDAADDGGSRPVHDAATEANWETVRLLEKLGADIGALDGEGYTASELGARHMRGSKKHS
ncbi:MAG: hypothetical protein M1833_006023 [Piccolia ochrophora]|nr:MAG: hypothetical protein M1833_006023 [Piccolia ochrophora]